MNEEDERPKLRSRSNSRPPPYKSTNPYINFMQEFRKDPENIGILSKELFKRAGERWKSLSDESKMPYVEAAQRMKRLKDDDPAKPTKKRKTEKKKGSKKTKSGGSRSQSKSSKGKTSASLKQSVCSKCGHRHGSVIASISRSKSRKRDRSHFWKSPRDANTTEDSSVAGSDMYTYSSTSTASF